MHRGWAISLSFFLVVYEEDGMIREEPDMQEDEDVSLRFSCFSSFFFFFFFFLFLLHVLLFLHGS